MCDSYSPRGDGSVCGCGQHSPLLSLHQWQPARSGYTHGSNDTHAKAQLSCCICLCLVTSLSFTERTCICRAIHFVSKVVCSRQVFCFSPTTQDTTSKCMGIIGHATKFRETENILKVCFTHMYSFMLHCVSRPLTHSIQFSLLSQNPRNY